MLITPANLAAMFTAFSLQYRGGYGAAEIFWRTLATLVPSATETMTYAWMDRIPRMRKWVGPRVVQNAAARSYPPVVNDPFELTLEIPKHKIQDDTYGLYSPIAESMGQEAAKWPDQVVLEKLLENPEAFDGQAFFSKGHPQNLDDASAGTYDNLETGYALTLDNFAAAKARMRQIKGADGFPIGARGTTLIVGPEQEKTARTILQSQWYPKLADGGTLGHGDVAVVENVYRGTANLLVIDELDGGDWYLFDTTKPIRPVIFQLREAPVFAYLVNPTDPNVFWNKMFVMGIEARGAAAMTLPFLAFKGEV